MLETGFRILGVSFLGGGGFLGSRWTLLGSGSYTLDLGLDLMEMLFHLRMHPMHAYMPGLLCCL